MSEATFAQRFADEVRDTMILTAALPGLAVDGVPVPLIVEPASADELEATLRAAHADGAGPHGGGARVIPSGGGSRLGVGNTPDGIDALVSLARLDRIIAHEPADMTVTVEAGARAAAVQEALAAHGQWLPFDPPGVAGTIGGLLASGLSGPLRHRYGTARDWLLGTRVVHPDGSASRSGGRVVKNVSGYDLHKLYVGSLGTLAVLSEVTLKVAPLPRVDETLAVACPGAAAAMSIISACHERGLGLIAAELLSPTAASTVLGLAGWTALLRVGCGPAAAARTLREIGDFAQLAGGETVGGSAETWASWRRAFAPDALALRVSALPSRVADIVETCDRLFAGDGAAISATAAAGIARLRLTPRDDARAVEIVGEAREVAGRVGGVVFVESAPPGVKAHLDVFGPERADIAIMRRLKQEFDPKRILSPGRFAGRI